MDYQRVPAEHRGDFGVEGIAFNSGQVVAYQSYCPQSGLKAKDLYDLQRKKMTDDINKLCKNSAEFKTMLNGRQILRWVLAVPRHTSSQLNLHAGKKSSEVLAKNLPYIDPDFLVLIQNEDSFSIEAGKLIQQGLRSLIFPNESVSGQDIADWADQHDPLVNTMDRKIANVRFADDSKKRQEFRNEFVRFYIQFQNALNWLKNTYPDLWEAALQIIKEKEDLLKTECYMHDGQSIDLLRKVLTDVSEELKKTVPSFRNHDATIFARGITADWLMSCPLEFET